MAAYILPTPHYAAPPTPNYCAPPAPNYGALNPGYIPILGYKVPLAPYYNASTREDRGKLDCRAPGAVETILATGAPLQETA